MKKRQLKKIIDTYYLDADEDLLIPPSTCRVEERSMDKYYSKAFRISYPQQAKEIDEAFEKAFKEAQEKIDTENK